MMLLTEIDANALTMRHRQRLLSASASHRAHRSKDTCRGDHLCKSWKSEVNNAYAFGSILTGMSWSAKKPPWLLHGPLRAGCW